MTKSVFPLLRRGTRVEWSDWADARGALPAAGETSSFLNPVFTEAVAKRHCADLGVDFAWGGHGEDRSRLWQGSYLDARPDKALHLGIDLDAPVGTPVCVTVPCKVVRIQKRIKSDGDWGTVLVFELAKPQGKISHFLYAHLSPHVLVKNGQTLKPGTSVGRLGGAAVNGGWWPHLHVQALTRQEYARTRGDVRLFDGYGDKTDLKRHPDPVALVFRP